MKAILLAAALVAALPSGAAASDPAEIMVFANAFDRAQLAKDAVSLDRMVADDLVFVDGSGKRLGKRQFIDGWTAPGDRFDPIVLVDRTVTRLGPDAAIVGAETTLTGLSDQKPFSSRIRFADTFQRRRGQWLAVHIQVTPLR